VEIETVCVWTSPNVGESFIYDKQEVILKDIFFDAPDGPAYHLVGPYTDIYVYSWTLQEQGIGTF